MMSPRTPKPIKILLPVALFMASCAASLVAAPAALRAQGMSCAGLPQQQQGDCRAQTPAAQRAVPPASSFGTPAPSNPSSAQQPPAATPKDTTSPGMRKVQPIQPRVGPTNQ
jgi:hypothetical protein